MPMDWDEVEKRLKREAKEEELRAQAERDGKMDAAFESDVAELFGLSTDELRNALLAEVPDLTESEIREATAAWKKAQRAAEGGWLSSPDPAKAEKIIMSTRGLREVRKGKKSCAVLALMMLGSATLTIWGLVEGVAALLG